MLSEALNQTAVFWGSPTKDGNGKLSFSDPIEIDVRWEDKMELFLNLEGKQELSQAIIYSETDMEIDSYLYLGELTDLSTGEKAEPITLESSHPVKQFKKTVDIGGTIYVRKTWL